MRREVRKEVSHWTTDTDKSSELHEVVNLWWHLRRAVKQECFERLLRSLFAVEHGNLVVAICMVALSDPKVALGLGPPELRLWS